MNELEAFRNQFGPASKATKVFVKSNFEILATPDKISKPKRRPQVRPEGYVEPQPKPLKAKKATK